MTILSKLWSILTSSEKASAVGLICLMLFSMLLEMLGIGIVVPALAAMSGNVQSARHPAVDQFLARLGNPSEQQLVLGGLAVLLALYTFKAAFLLFVSWRQLNFVAALQNRVSQTLFTTYLTQPWTFHLQRNSAELVRNTNDVNILANTCTVMLGSLAEMLVVVGVMALLLWFEPVGAIAVGCLMVGATLMLDRLTRVRLVRWGELAQHHGLLGWQHMFQGLNGAKDVKVLGCEQEFIDQFVRHRSGYVRFHTRQTFFGQIPRLWYELLAVAALCLLAAVMVWQGKTAQAMIPTLGLFAAAAFRMLPSVNRLAHAMQSLRFSQATIDMIHSELNLPRGEPHTDRDPLPFSGTIEVEGVSFRYPSAVVDSLSGLSLTIPHGSSVGIIGGSGAGKSTLVDIILGLLEPSNGRVTVDGTNIATNIRGWQSRIGYVPQSIYLCDDSLRRNVAFGLTDDEIDDAAVRRALKSAQLEEFVSELPNSVDTLVGERGVRLSGGQRQRIGIARALYHDPAVLILDEATSALDTETETGVMDAVEALHGAKTLIIVAHRLTTVANCDVIYKVDRGRIVGRGTFAEVYTK
jgi:ABC-type multidrug transport system fused ATPase/permease subunit